jgi:pyruvate formate lyase activating enzyme
MRKAEYCRVDESMHCFLCPELCEIPEGGTGRCLGRGMRGQEASVLNYGKVVAAGIDPIEKKPLYHYYPGRPILSVGTFGCNLKCRFCQNSDISQFEQPSTFISPEQLCQRAFHAPENIGIAFTYNEPGIWFEYVCDVSRLLHEAGLKSVMVTNGYLSAAPFAELCRYVDAMNIDLKGFTSGFYENVCQGKLEPVKQNIIKAYSEGVHLELTNLVITGLNDDSEEFSAMVDWIADLSDSIPLHISRYFPRYLETAQATELKKLEELSQIATKKLKYVYLGNIAGNQNTLCPKCGEVWVERLGYSTRALLKQKKCQCGYVADIIF